MKHAANIRALKPDESVILTVIGKAGQSATSVFVGTKTGFLPPRILTIRAKKSDIDAFAEGKLSFDQFHQKTQLLSYPYLGGNIGGGPSRSSRTRMSDYMSELMREE